GQRRIAGNTAVCISLSPEMPVAAGRADTSDLCRQFCTDRNLVVRADRQHGTGHPVLAALMVNQAIRAELRQSQKPGAGKKVLSPDFSSACRDISHERQAWKIVAG